MKLTEKKILAVETCTTVCSVALWDGEKLYEDIIESDRSHSQKVLPMCEQLLQSAKLSMREIDAIACTNGPGAFTGLRIGVGVAKGLAFGQNLPIYTMSSLAVLAHRALQQDADKRIVALLDARMGELYCGEYENLSGQLTCARDDFLSDINELTIAGQIFAGTGAREYESELIKKGATLSSVTYPMASNMISLIHQGQIEPTTAPELSPVYLRNKVTY